MPIPNDPLSEIAQKYDCEKFTLCDYTKHYHRFFELFRDEAFNLFEIGVRFGASLSMWRDYFPNAYVYAIDTDPMCLKFSGERVDVRLMNQCDKPRLKELAEVIGKFKVIVDDGSHYGQDIVDSFSVLAEFLAPDGIYVIEDILPEYKDQITSGVHAVMAADPALKTLYYDVASYRPEIGMWMIRRETN